MEGRSRWKFLNFCMALNVLFSGSLFHCLLLHMKTHRGANDQEVYGTVAKDPCSGHGELQSGFDTLPMACLCHHGFTGRECSILDRSALIDIKQGDPKIFEKYWLQKGEDAATRFSGWDGMSYYSDGKQFFGQTVLDKEVRSVHEVVGNAITEGRQIVIGTGSTQLFQAALYALSCASSTLPKKVVAQAPYYSAYPAITDYLKSSLYHWSGDASKLKHEEEGDSYIELVTTPNNPSGELRNAVVNGSAAIHDLAYYWPHYTPITSPVDEEIMLFTLSKSTGHAGTRIGWAIVKDSDIAQRMAKYIELNTLGVSKDAQLRAAQILRSVANEYRQGRFVPKTKSSLGELGPHENSLSLHSGSFETDAFFHFGASEMESRWTMLRGALQQSLHFRTPYFQPAVCTFLGERRSPTPGFAWLECLKEVDCESFLKQHNILGRGGGSFGADPRFVRLSMLDRRGTFEALVDRLKSLEDGI